MKPFRITVVLLALLVLPMFATQALADFSATRLTESFINPSTKVSANSDTLVMAFLIPASVSGETLTTVSVRSFIELGFATERVRIWAEDGTTPGWQRTEDQGLGTIITSSLVEGFQTNYVITFSGLSYELTSGDTFYITLDMYNSYVTAHADTFHETGLEVVLDAGFIELKDGQVNSNPVRNGGYFPGPPDGFNPFILIFDTKGPQFDLHFCIEGNSCSTMAYYDIEPYVRVPMVDHEDTIRVCAKNIDPDIKGDIHVIGKVRLLGYVSSMHMFGVSPILLKSTDQEEDGCEDWCNSSYNTSFIIPEENSSQFKGVDADTGHWYVCAWAEDSAGNRDTICLGHEDLAYRIDTQDPIIDEISWELVYDWNGDGKIGLGDCIMLIAKGYSNPIEPLKECVQMRVDTSWMAGHSSSYPDGEWAVLSDTLQENNRIFRKVFCLTNPVDIDSTDCPVNFLVEAWDNACNHDTLRGEICGTIDLDPPVVSVEYLWETDYDTTWACMGLGDQVFIEATVGGNDIVSVVAWMDSAGIDELMQHNMPLPNRGGGIYDTIWTITEPPIKYGKDRDNTQPPARDSIYRAWVVACDDVGNCDTAYGDLNKTLDTRRPRPIGYSQFCPDSVPCALVAKSLAGGVIEVMWDTACDENDAYAFYVWALAPGESEFDSIGFTSSDEQDIFGKYWSWHSEPLEEGYWRFKIKTEDNCSNVGDFSCEVGAYADATPPHVCIAVPDSGLTFGSWFPIKAVADSESHDVDSAMLYYRLRPDRENPLLDPGAWTRCLSYPTMYRPGDGIVFTDSVHCLEGVDYIGWVEMIVVACDEAGNCQDTTMAYDDACLVDDDVFRPGHFLFYWDTLAPGVYLVSVNGFPSPQSACGFDVDPTIMNEIVIDVDGAEEGELFEVDVRAIHRGPEYRIFHQDSCAMPCTIWVSVEGWDEGTQNLYINVKDYDNDRDADLQVELCVPPPPPEDCIYISWPHEWMRIPCTGTSGHHCVEITARMYDYYQCDGVLFTEVRFQWSPNGIDTWETIADVIGSGPTWSTCWDNTGSVEHGDTVYFRVIAHDEFYMADTSYMVKVFVDCESPRVSLRIEDLFYTCGNEIPKVPCAPLILKAMLEDTLIDIYDVVFLVKRHSDPDLTAYWHKIGDAGPAWSDNIWKYDWSEPCCEDDVGFGGGRTCMYPGDYWDIRVGCRDELFNVMFDYDNDRRFDDSTFNDAVAAGAGITVFVDDEAPQPAISRVVDTDTLGQLMFEFVNPDDILGGSDMVYTKAFDSVTAEISVLPSEDTCEVMKVEYFACNIFDTCVHVGTSTDPHHYPVTFEPVSQGLMPPQKIENSWWRGKLVAVLYDSMGNSKSTFVDWYILDVTPSQAIIVNPENESFVWGSVLLESRALNAYEIAKVCYEYRPVGKPDPTWQPVNGGYPNACAYHECGVDIYDERFPIVWHTLNTVPDGDYYLRAVATDCSNNVDDDPPTIKVTVCNELPSVTILDPSICFRECSDDTVDTNGFVGDTVLVQATVESGLCPETRVVFMRKDIFDFPGAPWDTFGIDYWPTDGVYDVFWNTRSMSDGRYHLKARVYNAAGRYKDSEPIMVSVDNTYPLVDIVSINGQTHPSHLDISLYDTLAIQVVAWDSLSSAGATRCYNSGVTMLGFCVTDGALLHEGDCPLSQLNWYTDFHDGDTLIYWNVSGLDTGTYYIYVVAKDCIGNWKWDEVTIHVYDYTPPLVTIGGFYHNVCQKQDYIYGYTCDEDLLWAKFEYRRVGNPDTSAWLGVGEADWYHSISGQSTKHCDPGPCCCSRRFIQWVWDPSASLVEGVSYQGRILATDYWGNNSEDSPETYAPIVNFTYENGVIKPEEGPLGALSFEKNFMVGRMHGIVKQTMDEPLEPQVFALYLPEDECGNSEIECVWMQQNLNVEEYFAGSFEAGKIHDGGIGVFFSSVTKTEEDGGLPTGEEQLYTYLRGGDIMVVKVDRDLGTFTQYCTNGDVCVYVPGGALGVPCDKHLVVWPETMPPISLFQPTWIPVGDEDGFATYIGFTESCDFACGGGGSGGSTPNGDYCCFDNGRYATIKMNYSSELNVPAESLIVAWWDNSCGKWQTSGLHWGAPYSEGFNTEDHYVEFVAECLHGPFAVIYLQERECDGTIVVNFMDIEPYCDGYTSPMPKFRTLITDNMQGTDWIVQSSMCFKIKRPGEPYITIYDRGAGYDSCSWWAKGYGQYDCGGWDPVSGILGVGWNDSTIFWRTWYSNDPPDLCLGCGFHHYEANQNWWNCTPAPGLAEGDSFFAQVTAENQSHHSCTQTLQFKVDATEPDMWFADSVGAYVGKNPYFCMYFTDEKAGVDKSSIWIDIYGDRRSYPDPNDHQFIGTLRPDQLHWDDDSTVCVDLTFALDYGYLHVYVYGGPDCLCNECVSPQFYHYQCGIADCVGNRLDAFWQYFTVDADGPDIAFVGDDYCDEKLQFEITDDLSGLLSVYLYEDSSLATIEQDVHNPDFWWYTPSEGVKRVDIKATDNLGNETVFSFDCPSDCQGPTVTFADGYVAKNPTITFWVTDPAGVDWTTVNARVYGCGEECWYRAEDLPQYTDALTGEVTLSGCHLDCYDGNEVEIYVFSGTSYTGDGPCDLEGNCGKYRRCSFAVDGYGPSISWVNSSDPCDRPVKLKITDAKSGVAEVHVYEDGVEFTEALVYNSDTELWEYTPAAGMHDLDVIATDVVGTQTTYSFEVTDDCMSPAVSFIGGYVTKNPTLQFVVRDEESGVDWTTVNAHVMGCGEECIYLASELIYHMQNDTVTLDDCHLDCNDGNEVEVYVYSGTSRTGKGPADSAGNYAPAYSKCSYNVDAAKPYLVTSIKTSERPIEIKVADARSGIDWSTLEFYEDSLLICEGLECTDTTVVIDTAQGIIKYMPPAGRLDVQIHLRDYAGNLMVVTFYTEAEHLALTKPHNYPNPFDPREEVTHIVLGVNKTCNVTVKIYDFAGEYVRTVGQPNHEASLRYDELIWNGTTDDGTEVANGTYLCHIKARDNSGAIKTAVIKITVLKEDK